jgi:hypothetical protein
MDDCFNENINPGKITKYVTYQPGLNFFNKKATFFVKAAFHKIQCK